jgi:hypothetical protein
VLPNDRETLDMGAKTDPQGASKDLNLDSSSRFAIMFANVRKELGETLSSDGDYRVWIPSIKKAAGPSLFCDGAEAHGSNGPASHFVRAACCGLSKWKSHLRR